jgi:hypothetical protein
LSVSGRLGSGVESKAYLLYATRAALIDRTAVTLPHRLLT